jgi:hypothetical protein
MTQSRVREKQNQPKKNPKYDSHQIHFNIIGGSPRLWVQGREILEPGQVQGGKLISLIIAV